MWTRRVRPRGLPPGPWRPPLWGRQLWVDQPKDDGNVTITVTLNGSTSPCMGVGICNRKVLQIIDVARFSSFCKGDVICSINDVPVKTDDEIFDLLGNIPQSAETVEFSVRREHHIYPRRFKDVTELMITAAEGNCRRLESTILAGGQDGRTEGSIDEISIFSPSFFPPFQIKSQFGALHLLALFAPAQEMHQCLQLLLSSNIQLEERDSDGNTCLHWAAVAQYEGKEKVRLLLRDYDIDINTQNHFGKTALHFVAGSNLEEKAMIRLSLLLENGANTDFEDKFQNTPLHYAVESRKGGQGKTSLLLKKGADANMKGDFGRTCLHMAVRSKYATKETVQLLIKYGANMNIQDCEGQTPLHYTARWCRAKHMRLLLENGANVNIQDLKGKTALHLEVTSEYGDGERIRLLLARGADANIRDSSGETSLYAAAAYIYRGGEVVHLLLENGADPNIQKSSGETPLYAAAGSYFGGDEKVRLLLEKGADANIQQRGETAVQSWSLRGQTCLHKLVKSEWATKETVQLLIENGANVNIQNNDGSTPLHVAVQSHENDRGWEGVVSELLRHGANPDVLNKYQLSCVGFAQPWRRQPFQLLIGLNNLLHYGAKPPEFVPMSVIGYPRRGKTTFIQTLIKQMKVGWSTSAENSSLQSNARQFTTTIEGSAEDLAERTAGIEVRTIEFATGEKFRVSDFAGHLAFLMSHHHFLANEYGFYLTLLRAMDTIETMLEEARFWIQFALATRPVHYGLPSIVVAFSHSDICGPGMYDRAQHVLHRLCADFDGLAVFPQEKRPFLLDCRVWNKKMECLVEELCKQHKILRERMPPEPRVVSDVRSALDNTKETLEKMMMETEFFAFLSSHALPRLQKQVGSRALEVLYTITKVLDIQCEILCLEQAKDSHLVITHLTWLTRSVFECVLSPHNFPGLRLLFPESGVVPVRDVKEALRYVHRNVDAVFDVLVKYRVCLPCGRDQSLALFPSKAPAFMLPAFLRQIVALIAKVGRILTSTIKRVPLSPVLLHTIALDVLEFYNIPITNTNDDAWLWQDGVVFRLKDILVRLCRELPDGDIALTVGGQEYSEVECLEVANKVQEIGFGASKRVSDGSQAVWKVLSRTELNDQAQEEEKTRKRQALTVHYTVEEVQVAMTDNSSGTITRRGITDEVQNLLVVPNCHILTLSRKKWCLLAFHLKKDYEDAWQRLGRELKISDEDLCQLELKNVSASPGLAFELIWFWARKLTSTVEALQDALLRMQRPKLAEILGPLNERQTAIAVASAGSAHSTAIVERARAEVTTAPVGYMVTHPVDDAVTHSKRPLAAEQSSTPADSTGMSTTGKLTDQASEEVLPNELLELASKISSLSECTKLAGKLDFHVTDIIKFRESRDPVEDTAQIMLLKWSAHVRASATAKRSQLVKALKDIKRHDLAEYLEQDFEAKSTT